MKRKVGREWIECGPCSPSHSLLSIVLPSRHTHGGVDLDDERTQQGFVFPEKGKRPFQAGGGNRDDIGTHEITS